MDVSPLQVTTQLPFLNIANNMSLKATMDKMKRILFSDWLPEQARWVHFILSGLPTLILHKPVILLLMPLCHLQQ